MSNSNKKSNQRPQLDDLPPELRKHLIQFKKEGYITDGILPDIQTSLLDAINNQEVLSEYSSIYPKKIYYNINELIVWIGVNFSIFIEKKEFDSLFEQVKASKRICLVYFHKFKRYDFIWENDIEDKIKDKTSLTITEGYNDMLRLVRKFKKAMQQKIGNLPYLGEKNDRGDWFLLGQEICRPDYNEIKAEPLISLRVCICTLLGIDDFMVLPFAYADDLSGDINDTIKYREGWRDVKSFIKNFISKLNRELNAGFIKRCNNNTLSFSFHDIVQENHQCDFEPLPFFKWADEAGYAIPDELSVIENADGTLRWLGSNTDHVKHDKKSSLDDLLLKAREEIDILYNNLKQVLKSKGKGLFDTCSEDVKEAFQKRAQHYKILIPEDIKSEIKDTNNPTRDIKGKLILNIVQRILPEVFIDKKISTDYQSLYQRSSKLKKKLSKK